MTIMTRQQQQQQQRQTRRRPASPSWLVLVCAAVLAAAACDRCDAFQFMSKWKLPEKNPHSQAVQERFGDKKLVVITGTSSGLGRKAAQALLRSGEYHVIGAVRDLDKMQAVAEIDGFPNMKHFTPMHCELNSFESVRNFCQQVNDFRLTKPIDRLICNAGVYQPSLEYAKWSKDNHEQTMQINFLSHFLMTSILLEGMLDSTDARVTMVGSVTGNDNTVGGGGVYPIADLHELDGFKAGFSNPIAMADGYGFVGAKAYKDSKLCLMMMSNLLHYKYHKQTGIAFSSLYPGCIAESPLFREKRSWFRQYFPIFMKFITGGFVGEHEAGQRLFQVAHDPRCSKSGVYWSWNGGPREGRGAEALEKGGQISGGGGAGGGWDSIFENDQSGKVLNLDTAVTLFECSNKITGATWPDPKQVTSPCPTLKVIGAVTKGMVKREELKRMRELGRPGMEPGAAAIQNSVTVGEAVPVQAAASTTSSSTSSSSSSSSAHTLHEANKLHAPSSEAAYTDLPTVAKTAMPPKLSRRKRIALAADSVVSFTLSNTIGRVARFAGKRVLGEVPEEAKTGSFQDPSPQTPATQTAPVAATSTEETASLVEDENAMELLEDAISKQLKEDTTTTATTTAAAADTEDERLFEMLYTDTTTSTANVEKLNGSKTPSA
eukprot:CAMPEP_0119546770 /NCGR_PEP_ID=MMETSP1352-20130426/1039_1 /TAXON_ID=265584 /ORGANISM="Stauroneis constricta, Strain CCMP1120" /LENGTH=660 /DNA_ID=CAMNT_0007591497 /DNA_START=55 /DNA_END=2037 /DNA_ORIENTATION=+